MPLLEKSTNVYTLVPSAISNHLSTRAIHYLKIMQWLSVAGILMGSFTVALSIALLTVNIEFIGAMEFAWCICRMALILVYGKTAKKKIHYTALNSFMGISLVMMGASAILCRILVEKRIFDINVIHNINWTLMCLTAIVSLFLFLVGAIHISCTTSNNNIKYSYIPKNILINDSDSNAEIIFSSEKLNPGGNLLPNVVLDVNPNEKVLEMDNKPTEIDMSEIVIVQPIEEKAEIENEMLNHSFVSDVNTPTVCLSSDSPKT